MKTASIHHPQPTKGTCGGAQKAYLFKQLGGWRRRELIRLLPTNVTVSIRNTHRTVILLRQLDGEQRRAENTSRSSSGSSSIDFTSSRISCFGNSVIPCLQDQFIFWDTPTRWHDERHRRHSVDSSHGGKSRSRRRRPTHSSETRSHTPELTKL